MVFQTTKFLRTVFQAMTRNSGNCPPLVSFGVIADVHYADIDDGTNYTKTRKRYYRNSLSLVKAAVTDWKSKIGTDSQISFILDLGDLIDGFNVQGNSSLSALDTVTSALDKAEVPVYHLWGNHDLYNFTRKQLYDMPKMNPYLSGNIPSPSDGIKNFATYFELELCPGFRLVALDPYEISMLGVDKESKSYRLAEKMLRHENKNDDLNSPIGLIGCKKRFVQFNGCVSDLQLKWLDDVLSKSQQRGEVVLVTGHTPVYSVDVICLCWNYDEILCILRRYSCVLAYFAGHAHDQMYAQDDHGIHHLTFPGVIEVNPTTNAAHGTVTIYDDRVVVTDAESREKIELNVQRK